MRSRTAGSAAVEQIGLVALVAMLLLAAVAGLAADGPPSRAAQELATAIQRHIRCPAALPEPCWRDPLTEAFEGG